MSLSMSGVGRVAIAVGLVAVTWGGASAWAGKPEWLEQGRGEHERREDRREDRRDDRRDDDRRGTRSVYPAQAGGVSVTVNLGGYFGDRQRSAVHDYYAPQVRAGKCPPGLAKKHNGCLPPGQAKSWVVGQRLPRDVVTYPLPADLRRRLGTPPAGHEFVRVAGDILLIAVGTSMVIDAIEDLTR